MENNIAIELKGITKRFGSVVANKDINLKLEKGEILALLGENGSGKTTLMNMISGIYYPDEGQIFINGEEVVIRSPEDAFKYKIGMIHQHFKLVDVFTAAQNIVLGLKNEKFKMKNISAKAYEIALKYGFILDPDKKIYDMSVSEKQTVEIIKVLYRGADILILDEPTAVLTPQEIDKLFTVLRKMKEDGKSIIIITHKLNEVMAISDNVAVLRKGEYIGTVKTSETSEEELTEMMVGKKVALNIERSEPVDPQPRLVVKDLNCVNHEGVKVLKNISFEANSGEILGIAGILNQVVDKIIFPFVYPDPVEADVQLGIYGATSKIAMIMAMFTQAFRFAYEPFVFGKSKEKDNRQMYAQAMKFFIIFPLLAFLTVMFYLDILRYVIGRDYWEGLKVVPIVMAAEMFMGVYFNLSFWYKLTDETKWGAYFSLTACTIVILMNAFLIPVYGYMACAWAGFTGYAVAMLLSYFVGQKKYPIAYDLKSIGGYVLLALMIYVAGEWIPVDNMLLRLLLRTLLLFVFIGYIIKHDLPLKQIPVINRFVKK